MTSVSTEEDLENKHTIAADGYNKGRLVKMINVCCAFLTKHLNPATLLYKRQLVEAPTMELAIQRQHRL